MIASFLHNFVFIKTKKTGGTAVEVTLGAFCGPVDIITPLGPHDELLRATGHQLVCRNFASDPVVEQELKQAVIDENKNAYTKARRRCEFYAHMRASEIRARLDADFWQNAYKITVERHPYEKVVSGAFFYHRPRQDPPFPEFLDRFVRGGRYATYGFYTIDGAPVVDEFLRQETLLEDLKRVGEKLGFKIPEQLQRTKTRSRKDRRPAREILSEEQKEFVYEFCRPEFDLLGYER
ncbi:MAG: hypothetical protein ACJ8IR_07095 [Alphaproteobacteria bacterium]|jgi:hypothetical protein